MSPPRPSRRTFLTAVPVALLLLSGCVGDLEEVAVAQEQGQSATPSSSSAGTPSPTQTPSPTPSESPTPSPTPTGPQTSDGQPQTAYLSLPDIDIDELEIEPYEGFTDDAPGTVIQDGGIAASPHGSDGGVGPGGIGNYQVTAHRNSAGGAFFSLPDLEVGDLIEIVTADRIYLYEVVETRETSFRSEESLAEQRAAVPGSPGEEPTQAMITLSTCATQEDHAAGNYWSDEFGNPEHRIDKIGVLVESRAV